ncbi:serine O-acetyltransferase [Sphingopyxis granuli]|uniref:serine O-acetyltransferase n=1 Tax=Sphingopyxis granuli TaxID=267128 RepID=UPI001BAF73D1|nr:hypothetical protein [Sphingopyxis granuli]QUM71327.1 serine acetyltransferase [Sphingopyxis granuli]
MNDDPQPLDNLRTLLDADWRQLSNFAGSPAVRRKLSSNFSPRFMPVVILRIAQRLHVRGWPRIAKMFSLLNFLLFGLEAPARLSIGPGLVLPHTVGTILGARSIGANVTIYQQVTLGAKVADYDYVPEVRPLVEDGALITAGAKIIGPVTIGRGSVVGANAVVLEDVPPLHMAVGVPAAVKPLGSYTALRAKEAGL